ncbi:MAG: MBL fold metallo-hydrolase, partial [Bacteroidales bacterium]
KLAADFIAENELKVVRLLNTHLHFDHCFGAPFVYQTYGCKICANDKDYPLIDRMQEQLAMFGFPKQNKNFLLGEVINEGDIITFGNTTLTTFHIPGHSPGSIVYYESAGGNLFTGDVLFKESVGLADLPGGDYFQLRDGIESKLLVLPPTTVVYPGHGPSTTIEHEINHNPYLR